MRVISFPEKMQTLATRKARHKVARGGRGSSKSWSFAGILLLKGIEAPLRILCAREIQRSLKQSVHKLLSDTITRYGLEQFYTIQNDTIVGVNGTTFFFCGLYRNVSQIKSFEGIDIVWVEEGENISKASWDILTPTIRKEGSEIWVSYNPKRLEDFVHQMFSVNEPPPDSIVLEINYNDNPYFPAVLEAERQHCEATDPDLHEHVWLGQPEKNSQAQIFAGKWCVKEFDVPDDVTLYHGIDWGFGPHPCAFVRCWERDGELYVRAKHVYRADLEDLPDHLDEWFDDVRDWTLRADPADPSCIRYVRNQGFLVKKASKPPGSIKTGIRYLRAYKKINFHPDDADMVEEARLYKYKCDPITGDVTPIILDAYNHGWDALRYALSTQINRGDTNGTTTDRPGREEDVND